MQIENPWNALYSVRKCVTRAHVFLNRGNHVGQTFKTIRFNPDEIKDIKEFVKMNPMFDFSSLARAAIAEFIREPRIKLHSIHSSKEIKLRESFYERD
jgi:hypothetical protein